MTQEGEMKNICPWDITAGRELPSPHPPQSPFFYTTVLDQGKGEGGGSYANAWQSFMASRNVVAGCISLTLAKKKKHLFKTFLSQEGADKRAAILVRKARMLYKKKPT